jgi:hypothetical protein
VRLTGKASHLSSTPNKEGESQPPEPGRFRPACGAIVVAIIVPIFVDNDRDNDSGDPRRLDIICRWTITATIITIT